MITVYVTTGCGPCTATKRHLTKHQIEHQLIDVAKDPQAREKIRQAGFTQLPIIENPATGESWTGFLPEKLNALKKQPAA